MVSGEFCSMTALHNTIPDATPEPLGWGTYASNPKVHFFLCRFIDMVDEIPGSYVSVVFIPFTIIQLGNDRCPRDQHYHPKVSSTLLQY